ncbi:MAG: hypothetical protein A2008_14120 [Candidatus Wallbacteria bacterium GWC2_49_35]|uniref:Uncharacterized protein n=1 Tax=Candidatus Wallbacteria bacterium GWC2_49_35 TaxID=1817813 RepID=A0A1F7X0F2_9BACT|nr:MAG: hypothetical protein A2008_14120 [Candidatus Wallbacteria bacterium GWC2_49_35]HBC73513.1 hypothetical protein [Candidatus Wallbacteria bacterium]
MPIQRCNGAFKISSGGFWAAAGGANLSGGRRGMALALVIGMAVVLFIGLASLTFTTREESGQASKFIFKIKAECLSEAVHTFLLSESFSYSWDARFYKTRQIFSSEAGSTSTYPVELMKKSIGRLVAGDPVLADSVGYDGYIESETINGMRVIVICVNVTLKLSMLKNEVILTHTYYDLYKRNLLDSLGETVSFFYNSSGAQTQKISDKVLNSLQGALSFDTEIEREARQKRANRKKSDNKRNRGKGAKGGKGGGKGK